MPPALLAALLLFAPLLQAQGNLSIAGVVIDGSDGTPVSGAVVIVPATGDRAGTDPDGRFTFANLPAGRYRLAVTHLAYRPGTAEVAVTGDLAARTTIALQPHLFDVDSVTVAGTVRPGRDLGGDAVEFTPEAIARYRGLGLAGLLRQVPGVRVESGGSGGESRVRIHAGRFSQVLVLLDGQRLNDPQTGEVDLSAIDLADVSRIRVIRQGNATLYGSNAFDGVVALETRDAADTPRFSADGRTGSFASTAGSLSGDGRRGPLRLLARYGQEYSAQDFRYPYEGDTYTRRNAWYRHGRGLIKLQAAGGGHEGDLRLSWRDGAQGVPSGFYEERDPFAARKVLSALSVQYDHRWLASRRAWIDGAAGYHRLDSEYRNLVPDSPFLRYHYSQVNRLLEGRLEGVWLPHPRLDLRLGGSLLREDLDHRNRLFAGQSIGKRRRTAEALFGGVVLELPVWKRLLHSHALRVAQRWETGLGRQGGWFPMAGYSVTPALLPSLHLGVTRTSAIRYPDFNSLFWKGDARARGNPELLPEEKESWSATLRWNPEDTRLPRLHLTAFDEEIEHLIFWHQGVSGTWEPRNEDRASKRGMDLQVEQQILADRWHLQAGYGWLDARNGSAEPTRAGKELVFTPAHSLSASTWARVGRYSALLTWRAVDDREVVPANTGAPLDPYAVVDLSLSVQFATGGWRSTWRLSVTNLTDEAYALLRGYPMPGRAVWLDADITHHFH